ncbi:MAG: MFS transporter [Chloroflexota bacterium]|nr:MAG: MFS transporter [Chloroflexota bacterium]
MRRAVLRAVIGNAALRRIAAGFAIFTMAEHATWIAVLVFAYGRGGTTEAGVIALVMLVPAAVLAPFAATAGDRFPRRRVLVAAYGIQAMTMLAAAAALLSGASALVIYALVAAASASIVLTRPVQGALLPHVVRHPDELTAANVVAGTIEGVAILVGPAIAGIVLATANPGTVFLLFGVLLAGSALLMIGLRVEPGPVGIALDEPVASAALDGIRTLRSEAGPRLVVAVVASAWILWGTVDVLSVMLAIDLLKIGEGGAGFLVSAIGAGGLIGSVGGLALVGRRRLAAPLLAGVVLWGLPLAGIGIAPEAAVAFAFVAVAGAGRALLDAAGRTLLQRVSTDDVLARILGALEGLQMAALALGSIAAPVLVLVLGPQGALIVAGLIMPTIAALAWRGLRAIDTGVVVPDERLDAIRSVPMFAPLAPAVVERLAAGATAWTASAGTAIITEGEAGDAFHLIVSGTVEVTIGGRVVRTEGPGDYFGEIALVRDIPRTATIVATTDVELLSIARDPFLAALTGHRASRTAAEAITTSRFAEPGPGS